MPQPRAAFVAYRTLGAAVVLHAHCAPGALAQVAPGGEMRDPDRVWTRLDAVPQERQALRAYIRPASFTPFEMDRAAAAALLARAPMEFTPDAANRPLIVSLPTPTGGFERFALVESPVMEPALAATFPEIRTYAGKGLDDPHASVRLDLTPAGFHAQVLTPKGSWYIDPYSFGDEATHTSYFRRDFAPNGRGGEAWECLGAEVNERTPPATALPEGADPRVGEVLRTYRLANAATGEYTAFFGGTAAQGQAAIVTAINRVSGVYEREVSVRLVLVANNQNLVYTNSATDPYTNSNGGTMLGQNQSTIDSVIGPANYDIGHVFSTGGGGVAGLRVVCVNGNKARGVTGLGSPVGDPFYIDYVAHEMGHQFGGNHSFNGSSGSCGGGNRAASAAYEPGSGSTIMAYAGICGADNLQANSDAYFTSVSYDEIVAYTTTGSGGGCPAQTPTGNLPPTVSAGPSYTIPIQTPFTLTAAGSDPNGDALTYCWEQRNLGAAQTNTGSGFPDNGSNPFLRSFNPTASPSRTFPRLGTVLGGAFALGEAFPNTNRVINFRVTARDNRPLGGGTAIASTSVTVTTGAGPFRVTSPTAAGITWNSGPKTVTWAVANTNLAPVSVASVRILLSTDGGNTFPTVLAASAPNSGSATVVPPAVNTTQARIRVEAVGNIFFNVSQNNFTISGCSGDANGDGTIDFQDLNIVLGQFGQSGPGLPGDINGDGQVTFTDLNIVLGNFGISC